MSIIYRALQKTQKSLNQEQAVAVTPSLFKRIPWLDVGLILSILFLFTAVVLVGFPHVKNFMHITSTAKVQDVPAVPLVNEDLYKRNNILNGVFRSNNSNVAMINNKLFNIGDLVDGMRIVDIGSSSVTLQHDKQVLVLQIAIS